MPAHPCRFEVTVQQVSSQSKAIKSSDGQGSFAEQTCDNIDFL
jgi:hypothetical protein